MVLNSFLYELVGVLIALAVVVATYFKTSYKYWQKKGVPFIEPKFPLGNNQNPFNQKLANYEMVSGFYEHFKSKGHPFGGIYFITVPAIVLVDPDMVRNVMAKDFMHFTNRGTFYDEKNDPLSAHLFNLEGQAWRNMRTKLTPTFTTGKMKMMFETLLTCGDQMIGYIDHLAATKEPLDIKSILMYFTTDVIGSCAFGIDCNSFKDKDSEFIRKGRKIFVNTLARKIRFFFIVGFPNLCKKLKVRIFEKHLSDFYLNVVKDTVRYREERTIRRNDFMQILLEMKRSDSNKEGLTIEQIAAQSFVFFIAGFETSSTTMNFCLYELARHQNIQEKLRSEIREVLAEYDGKLTYESVMEMKYLGKVLDETLRKYPPVPLLVRKCVKDYPIPDTDITIEKNTRIFIPAIALHHDPEYYPDPEKFDPERFTNENKASRHPFVHLPFGEGPRNCIGLRFGLMQSRVGLSLILNKYVVKLNPKTPVPLEMSPDSFILAPKSTIYLDIEEAA